MTNKTSHNYVDWFRHSAPYIHAHRERTMVIACDGEAVAHHTFPALLHDLALLNSLGIRLVLVYGAELQINQCLKRQGLNSNFHQGIRISTETIMPWIKSSIASIQVDIEAILSMGVANSPMAGADICVALGNFVTAQPLGVHQGIDYGWTGRVRKINYQAIHQRLDHRAIVLLPPLGYSPTGEIFNLSVQDIATQTAIALKADKLICLTNTESLPNEQFTPSDIEQLLNTSSQLSPHLSQYLQASITVCRQGIRRAHLLDYHTDGSVLLELFTRDGIGSLITAETYEDIRPATINDLVGILELITPLEQQGLLVRRSREHLEQEITHFTVIERDGMIIACASLYPYETIAELACFAVHPNYRNQQRGYRLLATIEQQAQQQQIQQLFVLTTQTAHWFQQQGFEIANIEQLPQQKQKFYNYQRNSKVFIKPLKPNNRI